MASSVRLCVILVVTPLIGFLLLPITFVEGNATEFIRVSCNSTLYPELCYASLSVYANSVRKNPATLARIAVTISLSHARRTVSFFSAALHHPRRRFRGTALSALRDCTENIVDAVDRINLSLTVLRQINRRNPEFIFQLSNVQTWMSAALTSEETCTDGFDELTPVPAPLPLDLFRQVARVKQVTSNALALVNRVVSTEVNA